MKKIIQTLILQLVVSASKAELIHLIDEHWIDTDATVFVQQHNNKSEFHNTEDLEKIRYAKNLRVLDQAHGNLDDISFLEDLRELRILLLGANNITDISVLAKLPNLEYIELFKNKITDISPLAELTNLLDINLCFNQIESFAPLYQLPKLERLWMYSSQKFNTRPPKDLVASIQENLPNCYIDSTSYSTLGGWREHSRWYVIRNMTRKAMEWLPWDSNGYTQDMKLVPAVR